MMKVLRWTVKGKLACCDLLKTSEGEVCPPTCSMSPKIRKDRKTSEVSFENRIFLMQLF